MGRVLIAVLGVGRGSWGHVARLISEEEWDRILLIGNEWGKENFSPPKEVDWVIVNNRAGFEVIKNTIKEKLPDEEIFVSIISGSGKEHMALIAALKEENKSYKIVVLTGEGTKYY
jgi:hypothetical protein